MINMPCELPKAKGLDYYFGETKIMFFSFFLNLKAKL